MEVLLFLHFADLKSLFHGDTAPLQIDLSCKCEYYVKMSATGMNQLKLLLK